jgi:hypothetical protein
MKMEFASNISEILSSAVVVVGDTYNNNIITMAQQPYMGSGLLFPSLLGRVHLWQLVTGQLAALLFYPS